MRWALFLLPLLLLAPLPLAGAPAVEEPGPKVVVGPLLTPPNPDAYATAPYILEPTGQPVSVIPAQALEEIVVLLIEFPGQAAEAAHSPAYFDDLLFDDAAGASSVRAFYRENSYGQTDVDGTVTATWYLSGAPMAYYGADSSEGIDDENGPVYCLAVEAALEADDDVDFADFDRDGDGMVDHLMIVHAGAGQEDGGGSDLIWSHRWAIIDASDCGVAGRQLVLDGVRIYGYFMTSEDSPMGVFAHEFGHDFGLVDLYDTTGNTLGIGVWGLMGTGSWNGAPRGSAPAHFIAWHKALLGWLTLTEVSAPLLPASLPPVETDPVALKLPIKVSPFGEEEYFVVENRQQVGFDAGLPGSGLLIFHVDETRDDNDLATRRLVDLEEADEDQGFFFAERPEQATDAWQDDPVGFTDDANATPNSEDNNGAPTGWKVTGISPSGPVMTANVSRGVALDLAVQDVERGDFVAPNATADLGVLVVNRGRAEVDNATVRLDVYYEAYDLDARVVAEEEALPALAEGAMERVTFPVTPALEGRYLVEAQVVVEGDELPENNLRIVHFLAVETLFWEDVEGSVAGWDAPTNLDSAYRWEVVEDGDGYGLAHSPTRSWRFGYFDTPGATQTYASYLLESPAFVLQGATPHLAFYQRYRLTTRTEGVALQPLDSDEATVEASVDGGAWTEVALFRGIQEDWTRAYVNLSALADGATTLALRFRVTADVMPESGGWWIDDVVLLPRPLERAVLLRPLNTQEDVVAPGSARFDFLLVNVGDLDDAFTFQVDGLPTGWNASIGDNETAATPVEAFNVTLATDAQLLLTLVVRVPILAERGTPVEGTLRALAADATAEDSFTFIVQVPLGFGLNLSGRTLVVALIIGGLMLAIAAVLTAMRNRRRG